MKNDIALVLGGKYSVMICGNKKGEYSFRSTILAEETNSTYFIISSVSRQVSGEFYAVINMVEHIIKKWNESFSYSKRNDESLLVIVKDEGDRTDPEWCEEDIRYFGRVCWEVPDNIILEFPFEFCPPDEKTMNRHLSDFFAEMECDSRR